MIDYRDRIKDLAKSDRPNAQIAHDRMLGFIHAGQNLVEEINSLEVVIILKIKLKI